MENFEQKRKKKKESFQLKLLNCLPSSPLFLKEDILKGFL